MVGLAQRSRWLFAVRGLAAIGLGVAAIAWPAPSFALLAALFGAFALVDGGALAVAVLRGTAAERRAAGALAVVAASGLVAGLATFAWPGLAPITLLYIVVVWGVAGGIAQAAAALRLRRELNGEPWLLLGGGLMATLGVALVAFRGAGLETLVLAVGTWMVALGMASLGFARRLWAVAPATPGPKGRRGGRMRAIRSAVRRRPVTAFLVFACAITWALTALIAVSLLFGLLALFGPAVAALLVARIEGPGETAELRERITAWRRPAREYAIAFGLPFAVAGAALLVHLAMGGAPLGIGAISTVEVLIFGLVIGEEIGWRGFLQPRLRARHGAATAGVQTGIAWTIWHLPLYLAPGLAAFAAFAWWVVPVAVVLGWVAERSRYSVIVATVMHGSANIAAPLLLPGVDRTWTLVVTGAVYLGLALLIALRTTRVAPQVTTLAPNAA